jgi:hypothetical protein
LAYSVHLPTYFPSMPDFKCIQKTVKSDC